MQMYFERKGIPASKIKIESKGEKEPVADNSSDEGRAKKQKNSSNH
jgi:outer membrane protein OmpA-like peptidoglycan-associated protein